MRAKSAWTLTFACGLCLVVLVVGLHIADASLRAGYFSADHIYVATLFEDLLRWNGKFSEWNLTPAPYFFPDMMLYGLVRAVAPSIEVAQYGTDLLQLLLVIFAAQAMLRRALPDLKAESALVVLFYVPWTYLHFTDRLAYIWPAMVIASHGGGLLATLVVFTLCLQPTRRRSPFGILAVALISALSGASDALFVISCSLPLAATVLWYGPAALWRRSRIGPPSALLLGRCFVGAIAGASGLWLAREYGLVHAEISGGSLPLAIETWRNVLADANGEARGAFLGLGLVALLAIVMAVHTWGKPHRAGLRALSFWQLSVAGAVVSAFLYNGAYSNKWTLRYLVTPCNFALIYVAAVFIRGLGSKPFAERPSPWPGRVAVLATLSLFVGVATQASALVTTRYEAPQRSDARCVADIADREGIDAILGEYWVAKPLMLLSDGKAHVVQVMPELRPNFWICSRDWFRTPRAFGMVITNGLDLNSIERRFGRPQRIQRCGEYEVFIYDGLARVRVSFDMVSAIHMELPRVDAERQLGW